MNVGGDFIPNSFLVILLNYLLNTNLKYDPLLIFLPNFDINVLLIFLQKQSLILKDNVNV